MFGKLKDKLKAWVKNSKEKVEKTTPKEEIEEEIPGKKEKKTKEEKKSEKEKLKKEKVEAKEKKREEKKAKKERRKEEKEEIQPGKPESTKEKDEIEILSEKSPEEITKITGKSPEEVNEELEELKEEEVEKEIEKTNKLIEETKTEKIPEIPKTFNAATKKYEPDTEKLEQEIKEKSTIEEEPPEKKGFFKKLKSTFTYQITEEEFNEIFDDLEMLLLENNVALEVTEDIRKHLAKNLIGKEIKKQDLEQEITKGLKNSINEILIEPDDILEIIALNKKQSKDPFVILFFGINGTGKTTSIAKITNLLKENNLSVVLAAADTFRAAAIQQIQIHADKLKVPLIKHDYGADPSAVGFDAIKYAKAHNKDVVLIDTAGRMHTKQNLLQEMEKICRVTNPDLKIFVAESIAGNDATEQARSFNDMITIDGSILSKVDIDEKGGTIISVSHVTHKPIFYLGIGQEYKDIKLFNKEKFIEDLGL